MRSKGRELFCIDSSAFITMHRFYSMRLIPDLWDYMEELFVQKKIFSHKIVYNEIVPKSGKKDALAKWISNFKSNFFPDSSKQLEKIPDILKNFPKLIDAESEKEQADPWLIALLIEIMEENEMFGDQSNYILVTTERESSPHKLPAACKYYNIRHMNLFEFFEINELKFTVRK